MRGLIDRLPPVMQRYLALLVLGGLGLGALVRTGKMQDAVDALSLPLWRATPCQIVECRPQTDRFGEAPYGIELVYRYRVDGTEYSDGKVHPDFGPTPRYERIQRLLCTYPAGSETTCFVSPFEPDRAYLLKELSDDFILFVGMIPLSAIAVILVLRWKPRRPGSTSPSAADPVDQKGKGYRATDLALLALALAIGVCTIPRLAADLDRVRHLDRLVPTPCRIVYSGKRIVGGSLFPLREDILYEYTFAGQTLLANGFEPMPPLVRRITDTEATIAAYPVGSEHTCYVEPERPWSACLVREFRPIHYPYLFAIFLVAFVVPVGAIIEVWWQTAKRRREKDRDRGREREPARQDLPPLHTRGTDLAFWVVCGGGLVGSGMGALTIYLVQRGFSTAGGAGTWLLAVLAALFTLGIVLATLNEMVRCASPLPAVRVVPGQIRAGEPACISWRIADPTNRIRAIVAEIEARGLVEGKPGGRTEKPERKWHAQALSSTERKVIADGNVELMFPPAPANNRSPTCTWVFCLQVKLGHWWNYTEEYQLPFEGPAEYAPMLLVQDEEVATPDPESTPGDLPLAQSPTNAAALEPLKPRGLSVMHRSVILSGLLGSGAVALLVFLVRRGLSAAGGVGTWVLAALVAYFVLLMVRMGQLAWVRWASPLPRVQIQPERIRAGEPARISWSVPDRQRRLWSVEAEIEARVQVESAERLAWRDTTIKSAARTMITDGWVEIVIPSSPREPSGQPPSEAILKLRLMFRVGRFSGFMEEYWLPFDGPAESPPELIAAKTGK